MFKENRLIIQNHTMIVGVIICLSILYILDILPYNTTLGNFNIKWAVAILLVLAVWVVYELYLQPKQRKSTRLARGPSQQSEMPPQEQFSPIAPPYPRPQQSFPVFGSQQPPPYQQRRKPNIFFAPTKEEDTVQEQLGPSSQMEILDDGLPPDYTQELDLPQQKSKQIIEKKDKSAFEHFGLE